MMRNESLAPVTGQEPVRLTKEEEQYLRTCLKQEIWTFELPCVIVSGIASKVAMNYGYLKQSKSNLFALVLGTFVVSRAISYSDCFKKLLEAPGSNLSERMRSRIYTKPLTPRDPREQPIEPDTPYQQPNYLDIDTDRPDLPGIDPSVLQPSASEQLPPKPSQSYSELRRQNRDAYWQQFLRGVRPPGPESAASPPPRPQEPPAVTTYDSTGYQQPAYQTPSTTSRNVRMNKYGDIWDE